MKKKAVFKWQFTSVFKFTLVLIEDTKHRHVWERKGVEDKTDFYLPVLSIFSFNVSSRPFRKCLWYSWTILTDLEKLVHKPT